MTLYLKYRPKTLDTIVGNRETVISIDATLKSVDPPHTFLLHGPTGTGKTTTARIMASKFGCTGNDLREVDSADFRGIDTIREIRRQSSFRPLEGKARAWILDECHALTSDAQNALLKILEDTPKHVFFFLCTTNPQKLLETVKGRCTQYQMTTLNDLQTKKLLRDVVQAEQESLAKDVYDQIILDSQGRPRDALQILEKVLSVDPHDRLVIAQQAAEQQSQIIELCRAMINAAPWSKISKIIDGLRDEDPEGIRRHILKYFSSVILTTRDDANRAATIMEEFIEPFYDTGFPGLVYACYSAIQ